MGQFRVEPAAVSGAGARLGALSDVLGRVDLHGPLADAAGALTGAATAGQAFAAATELSGALDALAAAVAAMGSAAGTAAANYGAADRHSASTFAGLSSASPAAPTSGPGGR